MGLETVSFIDDLNSAWPLNTDPKSEGDDHLRAIKTALQASFPSLGGNIFLTANNPWLYVDGSVAMTGALDMGTQLINNVVDPVSAQDAATKASSEAFALAGRVSEYASIASSTIADAEAVEATIVIAIPAAWTTYDLELLATGNAYANGTLGGPRNINISFKETSTGGALIAANRCQLTDEANDRGVIALFGYQEGSTDSIGSSRTIVFTSNIGGGSGGDATLREVEIKVVAHRVT